ncbi:MAG: nucleotidyltransferase domain-containing protein [Methanosarcinaceae archaeon]|nr:nucleotidyltransferase domain-containing protein [Methanosarcinaceae archaeon]MDF1533280.1 nucleotidyltransferase domain-containing protein [Methanosarcinaceae archaeon]
MISRENIQDITTKIINSVHPEKIILFGSYAWGEPTKDSDLDLLIVMNSNERPIKRATSIRKACRDGYVPMDLIVRTSDEIQDRLDIGDPFIKRILSEEKMVYARNSTLMD